jgi:hypothetical protein
MANLSSNPISLSAINGGRRYQNGDTVDANAINAPIEASYYAQETANSAKTIAQFALDQVNGATGNTSSALSFLSIYPVGSVYISVNETSPASLFGGTWKRIQDIFLLAAGSKYAAGNTGGSADAVVVEHDHTIPAVYGTSTGEHTSALTWGNSGGTSAKSGTDKTGESGIGKNMPPYLVVYMWERTA